MRAVKNKKYKNIIEHYESCLLKHGDSHLGVDWPKKDDAELRYKIMLEVIRERSEPVTLLDFGCGTSHIYEYIIKNGIKDIIYSGLDLSEKFIEISKAKYPQNKYFCLDVLEPDCLIDKYDYIIMNGVFTEKVNLTFDEMFQYFKDIIRKMFRFCDKGMAFNTMSKYVDWERGDLFHLPLDLLAQFLTNEITRNFIIRNDYGLYEYTTYIYRDIYK